MNNMKPFSPPHSLTELTARAQALRGMRIGELAAELGLSLPQNLRYAKGLNGQILEWILGASAGNNPEPDFPNLGVELKSIPVNEHYLPRESTYVCTAPLLDLPLNFSASILYTKLRQVLWIPILWHATPAACVIGKPILWQPSTAQFQQLATDWDELTELITTGHLEKISARFGNYLQIRPKAANSKSLTRGIDAQGFAIATLPRGFYLRTSFTRQILAADSG